MTKHIAIVFAMTFASLTVPASMVLAQATETAKQREAERTARQEQSGAIDHAQGRISQQEYNRQREQAEQAAREAERERRERQQQR